MGLVINGFSPPSMECSKKDASPPSISGGGPSSFQVLNICGADPGQVELLHVSQLKIEAPEQATREHLLPAVNDLIDQNGLHFPAAQYRQRCGFPARRARFQADLSNPRYANLRHFNASGQTPRASDYEKLKLHIQGFAEVFPELCSIKFCRTRSF